MGIDAKLGRAIHSAVGMTDSEAMADPAKYIKRFVEMGGVIFEQRKTNRERDILAHADAIRAAHPQPMKGE